MPVAVAGQGSKVVNGARAKLMIGGQIVGIFQSINYSVAYDVVPVNVLGNPAAVELNYVGVNPVGGSMSGWRIVNQGPFQGAALPTVDILLSQPNTQLAIFDRQTGLRIGIIDQVKITGVSTGVAARAQSEMTINFTGLEYADEYTNRQASDADLTSASATQLP